MRIAVNQISEDGWRRTLEIPLASLARVTEAHGPQTGTLHAEVTLKNHRGCIGVRGTIRAEVTMACHVCLDRGPVRVEEPLDLMVAPEAIWAGGRRAQPHQEVKLAAADLDVSFYDGEELDLTQVLEDELLIALPDSLSEEDENGCCVLCERDVDALLRTKVTDSAGGPAQEAHPFRALADLLNAQAESGTKPMDTRRRKRSGQGHR
jgi:uncharacterized metal-binding protein YceD (DUF177 family)